MTASIIFLYVFVSLLVNKEKVQIHPQLNPLGEEVTDLYLAKMGAMVRGTVKGQFVIACARVSPGRSRSTSRASTTDSSSSQSC